MDSDTHTICHWKGTASYFTLDVEGKTNADAAWYYPEPRPLADGIKGRIAFWKDVRVIKDLSNNINIPLPSLLRVNYNLIEVSLIYNFETSQKLLCYNHSRNN